MSVFTVFYGQQVYDTYGSFGAMAKYVLEFPDGVVIYRRPSNEKLSCWIDQHLQGIKEEDVDPVLKMLVLLLNL